MAVTYDDVEERTLGRQAKIAQLADMQLENSFAEQERANAAEQQGLDEKTDAAMTEDALAFIDQMDQIHDNGGDPMEMFSRLPPEMQERVAQLLQGTRGQNETPEQEAMETPQQEAQQQFQPLPQQKQPMMPRSGQQAPVQQNSGNITDRAKQIAML